MARGWVPARLVALLAGLLGSVAKAETRLQAFEAEIAQPLRPGQGKRTDLLRYPGNEVESSLKARRGNDTGYLMACLQRLDPDVASKIGRVASRLGLAWAWSPARPTRVGSKANAAIAVLGQRPPGAGAHIENAHRLTIQQDPVAGAAGHGRPQGDSVKDGQLGAQGAVVFHAGRVPRFGLVGLGLTQGVGRQGF